ncbi:SRPBCC domain-containing protein [Paraflavitalea speifideaquila]|uniref:SRPBCC domain-containing protein n=1 Tax=Paraflavitalea speifideaquila TaxID=3076558 RepID=UPI0028E417C3|nr:SRPBCC domain-containing protein [Paraflavitalea speifideiaquila]
MEINPGQFLSYTTIDPHSGIDDTSENYLTVTYELIPENGHTVLTVTQGDYAKVAEGERRYQEAWNNGEGWNPILLQIKQLAEVQ